ncbi:MAG TPA: heparan-alpha-glucosaminide N-acetyltransferase domain-containing protein [Allosphingosinicella sp.]|nr:heparan-alpha-glucosaminide N-acetyltransferase domain-containing protein [Allosphingosinicella sp.]
MQALPRPRLAALDSFRGITVAAMILVNTPGSGDFVWWPLDHAEWHGFTPTDLVFPAFLCAMGMALGLSFPRTVDAQLWRRVVRRTFALIVIGWAWQMLARPSIEMFRVFGVLPRLGLCFGLAATLVILTARRAPDGKAQVNPTAILIAIAVLIFGYWAAMSLGGDFTPEGNFAGWFDRAIVGANHMWRAGRDAAGNVVYDPEGLFSTLPATANVLFGLIAALAWQRAPDRATLWIALAGIALVLLGLGLAPAFPINKKIWTSSYVLLSTGLSATLFAGCVVATRSDAIRRALRPFDVFGMNAILAYVVSLLIGLAGMRLGFQAACFAAIDELLHAPYLSSFLYALAVLLIVLALLFPLHRRGVHLRL